MIGGTFHVHGVFVEITQHNRALKRDNEYRRYLICVYSGTNLLALYTFVHDPMNGAAPTVHGGSSAVAQCLVGIIRLNRGIENRAATDNRGVFDDPLKDGDDGQETLYRVQLPCKRLAHPLLNQSIRVIERFQGQLFLTGEMVIDTPFLQPGFTHNVCEGCAKEALAIEELGRVCKNSLPCLFTLAHVFVPLS